MVDANNRVVELHDASVMLVVLLQVVVGVVGVNPTDLKDDTKATCLDTKAWHRTAHVATMMMLVSTNFIQWVGKSLI